MKGREIRKAVGLETKRPRPGTYLEILRTTKSQNVENFTSEINSVPRHQKFTNSFADNRWYFLKIKSVCFLKLDLSSFLFLYSLLFLSFLLPEP
jgi:hypothetical protein